ncbi:WecB/TagA/CpsF family glycosyltransferase [Eubacterium ramulus]|uniref:WecB/TagA/CpsF family glycosyltransferase n=1 Tax=Eubacterium ramulus TaxID=39490 RepID=UPI00300F110A
MKTVVTAGEDEQVRQCLEDMDLVIPSDKEILMEFGATSRKWLDEAREHRFVSETLRGVIRANHSVYLLYETRTQMDTLCEFLENSFGNAPYVCGDAVWEEAGEDAEQIVNEINAVSPHTIFSMLSTPRQEKFLAEHRQMLNARLWFGVGSENTFVNGKKKSVGICKKLLARHKMKRQIQPYESEEKTD